MGNELGESHRRVIGSGMLVVDSAAVRILDLLDDRSAPSAIQSVEGTITHQEKQEIKERLIQLQELIAALIHKYEIELSKKDLRRIFGIGGLADLGLPGRQPPNSHPRLWIDASANCRSAGSRSECDVEDSESASEAAECLMVENQRAQSTQCARYS